MLQDEPRKPLAARRPGGAPAPPPMTGTWNTRPVRLPQRGATRRVEKRQPACVSEVVPGTLGSELAAGFWVRSRCFEAAVSPLYNTRDWQGQPRYRRHGPDATFWTILLSDFNPCQRGRTHAAPPHSITASGRTRFTPLQ